jgi:DNA-binding CsgD family transcriptional regulator
MRIDFALRPELIGRSQQLDLVQRAISATYRTGTSSLVLIRGPGGIGKSRLLSESSVLAQELGFQVVTVRTEISRMSTPYTVFEEAIRELLVPEDTSSNLETLAEAFFDSIAIRPRSNSSSLYERNARRAISSVIAAAVQERPLLLALDDLHTTDRDSIRLLSHLMRDLANVPLVVIATARPSINREGFTLEDIAEQLHVDGQVLSIDLMPLSSGEISELLASTLDGHSEPNLVEYIHGTSAGNPFFALAAIKELTQSGVLERKAGRIILHRSQEERKIHSATIISRRFFKEDTPETQVARIMSAFKRFRIQHLELVGTLTGLSADQVSVAFDNLVTQELVVRTSKDDCYTFVHELLRNALYDSLGPAERASLHSHIANLLADSQLSTTNEGRIELAGHLASAGRRDLESAAHFLEAARIVGNVAPLAAADWYGRAALAFPAGSHEHVDALAQQSRNLFLGGQPIPAADVGLRALRSKALGEMRQRTASIVVNALFVSGDLSRAIEVIDIELRQGLGSSTILAQLCELLALSGHVQQAREILPDALSSLDGLPTGSRLVGLSDLMHYHAYCDDPVASLQYRKEINRCCHEASLQQQIFLWHQLALAAATAGSLPEAEFALRRTATLGFDEASVFGIAGTHATASGYVGWMRGNWSQTLIELRRSTLDGARSGAHVMQGSLSALQALILTASGEPNRALELLDAVKDPIWSTRALVSYAKALARRECGSTDTALVHLTSDCDELLQFGAMNDMEWVLSELADLQTEAGLHVTAENTLHQLLSLKSATDPGLRTTLVERASAIVRRDLDAALRSVDTAKETGLPFEEARGRMLAVDLGAPPKLHLGAALGIFDSLGALSWQRRAVADLRRHGIHIPRSSDPKQPTSLTGTESRLVDLVGRGMSNKQIALELNYSVKTVEVYLSRLYRKLDCTSRIGLIRAVERIIEQDDR